MFLRHSKLLHKIRFQASKSFSSNISQDIKFPNRTIDYFINPQSYLFIDKTKFFEKILSNNQNDLIYQPDSFGKTFNLEMFRYFVSDIDKVDNTIEKQKRKDFFEKTEIFKNKNLVDKHFAKHPVIYLNFKELDENNFEDNIEKLKFMLNSQIQQIFQYEKISSLNKFEIKLFEEFLNNFNHKNLHFISNVPKELAKTLSKLSQNHPFILLNDFDFPLVNSYGKASYDQFKSFIEIFIKNVFKTNNYIYKGVITGVNEIDHNLFFSQIKNLNSFSFKNKADSDINKYFGVTSQEEPLKKYSNNICKYNNFGITNDYKNISFYNFSRFYNQENLNIITEENLISYLNIDNIAEYLNIKTLFAKMINDSCLDYLQGYKILNLLDKKAENFIHNFKNNEKLNYKGHTFSDVEFNFDSSQYKDIPLSSQICKNTLISYMLSNNLIQLDDQNNIQIPNILSAWLIKRTFSELKNHVDDYDRLLAYNFYKYLYFNNVKEYFTEIKNIFEKIRKSIANKKGNPFSKPVNLIFKSEKEMENYFIHIMTLELNLQDSKDNINIYQIEDDENNKISDVLKKFSLITFDDRRFAIFINFNKHSLKTSSSAADELEEIDEVQKNEIIQMAGSKKRIPKVDSKEIIQTLENINQEKLSKIDENEAMKFLSNISDNFESVAFVCLASYQKFFEYAIQTFVIKK